MNELHIVLDQLMTGSHTPAPIAGVPDWWVGHEQACAGVRLPVHRAILGGFCADRLGYAFASGYREALCAAIADAGADKLALCASEERGAHPRFIECRLEPDGPDGARLLTGTKSYVTLGPHADGYIVIASTGHSADGQNQLAAVRIPRGRSGIALTELPPTPFVPELPHARIAFDRVPVRADEVLPGDGYEHYLKPFRTIEDIHVMAAACAWLVQVGRRSGWPTALVEAFVAVLVTFAGLAAALGEPAENRPALAAAKPALAPSLHVALAGALAQMARALAATEAHWADVDHETRARWQRDQRLLSVAGKARTRRREVAWQRLS